MGEPGTANLNQLPDDPALLKQIIAEQGALLDQQRTQIEKMKHEMEQLRRMHFGPRSERLVPEQMLMPFAGQSFPAQLPPPGTPPRPGGRDPQHFDAAKAVENNGHGRQKLPEHLKRVEVVHDVPEERKRCTRCKKKLLRIGEETSEQLEYTPSQLKVLKNIRPKYTCPDECEECGVVIAPPPAGPIEKGLPGPGLLAHVCVSKFDDHLPFYRQQEIFARQGVHIARSTQCDWIAAAAGLLDPLVLLMKQRVLLSKKIHTDDVPVPVLDGAREHTREARLWGYLGDNLHPYIVFEYSPTHAETYPIEFLKDFLGFLQCDAYPGYNKVRAIVVGCWAHYPERRVIPSAMRERVPRMEFAVVGWHRTPDIYHGPEQDVIPPWPAIPNTALWRIHSFPPCVGCGGRIASSQAASKSIAVGYGSF